MQGRKLQELLFKLKMSEKLKSRLSITYYLIYIHTSSRGGGGLKFDNGLWVCKKKVGPLTQLFSCRKSYATPLQGCEPNMAL